MENKPVKKLISIDGLELEIDPAVLDDYELFDQMAQIEDDPLMAARVIRKVTGAEHKKIMNHLRDDTGRVPPAAVMDMFMKIIENLAPKGSS